MTSLNKYGELESEATVCPSCGKPIKPEWKVCPNCAARLLPETVTCSKCGMLMQSNWKACPECGARAGVPEGAVRTRDGVNSVPAESLDPKIFYEALARGDYATATSMLDQGLSVDVDLGSGNGNTALQWACWKGDLKAAVWLLNRGADPNIIDRDATPLVGALAFGDDDPVERKTEKLRIAEELIRRGANVNRLDSDGHSIVMFARTREAEQLLLRHGAVGRSIYVEADEIFRR